jgi:diacylglycerol kinase (ATP)
LIHLIINPTARHGRAKAISDNIIRRMQDKGVEFTYEYTEYEGHATELAADAAARGIKRVFVLGGDGTATEAAKGLIGTQVVMGVIPAGTGNDFVRTLGIPQKPAQALDCLLDAREDVVHIAACNRVDYLNIASIGFDSKVLENTLLFKKYVSGMLAYLCGVFVALFNSRPYRIDLNIDGEIQRKKILLVAFANGKYYGGGMKVAPGADMSDELLDVYLVRWLPRIFILFLLPFFAIGKYMWIPVAEHYRCRAADVTVEKTLYNVDGELVRHREGTLHFQVGAQQLNVLVPKNR